MGEITTPLVGFWRASQDGGNGRSNNTTGVGFHKTILDENPRFKATRNGPLSPMPWYTSLEDGDQDQDGLHGGTDQPSPRKEKEEEGGRWQSRPRELLTAVPDRVAPSRPNRSPRGLENEPRSYVGGLRGRTGQSLAT